MAFRVKVGSTKMVIEADRVVPVATCLHSGSYLPRALDSCWIDFEWKVGTRASYEVGAVMADKEL
jgi:hypothetical protein